METRNGVDHAEKMHEVPDEYLAATLPVAKKIALALGCENYNILQVQLFTSVEPWVVLFMHCPTE